jgi:predicted nucleic acid-binding protein
VTRFFTDTNVLLYSIGPDGRKRSKANELISEGPVISVQVLNEFLRVATRKLKSPLPVALLSLAPIRITAEVVPLTIETHELAVSIMRASNIPVYDANIVAAAELSGCDLLYSEDMNHGQRIGRVLILNPFSADT